MSAVRGSAWDRLGLIASGACVVHCLLGTLLLPLLPLAIGSTGHWAVHETLLVVVSSLALAAFIPGYRSHRRWPVPLLAVAGVVLLAAGVLAADLWQRAALEALLTVAGGALLVAAHGFNLRLCRNCAPCRSEPNAVGAGSPHPCRVAG